jgi:hypothetical protein
VIGQARSVRGSDRLRRAHSGACDQAPSSPRCAHGQPPPAQGQLHAIGRLRPGFRATDVGQQVVKLVVQLRYNRRWVGSHRRAPVTNRWMRRPIIVHGAMAFNSRRSPKASPYRVPQILVTLLGCAMPPWRKWCCSDWPVSVSSSLATSSPCTSPHGCPSSRTQCTSAHGPAGGIWSWAWPCFSSCSGDGSGDWVSGTDFSGVRRGSTFN